MEYKTPKLVTGDDNRILLVRQNLYFTIKGKHNDARMGSGLRNLLELNLNGSLHTFHSSHILFIGSKWSDEASIELFYMELGEICTWTLESID